MTHRVYQQNVSLDLPELDYAIRSLDAITPPENAERTHWNTLTSLLNAYARTKARTLKPGAMTKADALHPVEIELLRAMQFGDGHQACGTCGTPLPNEAEFAAHYIVDDRRYLNLGHCPTRNLASANGGSKP